MIEPNEIFNQIRGLTLWQPWASFLAAGIKQRETRPWDTRFRGWLLIHAAKSWRGFQALDREDALYFENALRGHDLPSFEDLPRGEFIGIGRLDKTERTEEYTGVRDRFGDYSPGRFVWTLEDVRRFEKPIPFLGSQRLFKVPNVVLRHVILKVGSEYFDPKPCPHAADFECGSVSNSHAFPRKKP